MTKGGKTFAYSYGADGVRTQKTVDGVTTEYYTVGGKLLAEKTGDRVLTFYYDDQGAPVSVELNGTRYYYCLNLQGDVVGLYSSTGAQVASYTYDPWGKLLSVTDTSGTDIGTINPLRYRGYYYDTETGFYFLQSRYYDPTVGRFINADGQLSGVGGDMQGYNLFAYCQNDPVNMSDPTGHWPKWIKTVADWVSKNIIQPLKNIGISKSQKSLLASSSHDANHRPNTGEPGSTYKAPNGDTRTYGPDGRPAHDYDHNDHGRPDKHPHDSNGGHHHDWDWSNPKPRGDAYISTADPVIGGVIILTCAVGIAFVAINDVTGFGIFDDVLLAPLSAGFAEGLIKIYGQ